MIEIKNLSYTYRNGFQALSAVNLSIGAGIHLLLGENGAGKTTLLHIIAGLRFPTVGTCAINGEPTRLRLPSVQSQFFFYTDSAMFPYPTIMDMVKCHAPFYPTFSMHILQDCLKEFGMTGREPLSSLSFGNRRKAQIAYVLALSTPILLLDEPTNGLDITAKQALRRLIARHVRLDQCILISTHTVGDLESLFDHLIVIHHGAVRLSLPVDVITERLAFNSAMLPPAAPLYYEQEQGLFRYITPVDQADSPTDISYTLLYDALLSPNSSIITTILNTPAPIYTL